METPTNLNSDPKRTKLVAPDPNKKIKLKVLRDVLDPMEKDATKARIIPAGEIIELPLKEAKELVSRKYRGVYEFSGERTSIEKTGVIRMAEKYVEPTPEDTFLEQA